MTPKEILREIKLRHKILYNRYYFIEKYNFNENNKFLYDDLEKALKELEVMKKDVARYFELESGKYIEDMQVGKISLDEYGRLTLEEETLKEKLSQVKSE